MFIFIINKYLIYNLSFNTNKPYNIFNLYPVYYLKIVIKL